MQTRADMGNAKHLRLRSLARSGSSSSACSKIMTGPTLSMTTGQFFTVPILGLRGTPFLPMSGIEFPILNLYYTIIIIYGCGFKRRQREEAVCVVKAKHDLVVSLRHGALDDPLCHPWYQAGVRMKGPRSFCYPRCAQSLRSCAAGVGSRVLSAHRDKVTLRRWPIAVQNGRTTKEVLKLQLKQMIVLQRKTFLRNNACTCTSRAHSCTDSSQETLAWQTQSRNRPC